MNKAAKLRELLETKDLTRFMGAFNALAAKLVERTGFEAIWQSGLEVSTSFAVPDANILTMSEYLDVAISINDATPLPVMVDCDTGYGNSNNVIHMVKKFEAAGIAAVCIEDKMFPKVNSYIPGRQELAPIAEFVGKIMAAKNAQQSKDFMVVARVEALIAGWGQEEALKRANAYIDAGADAIFIHSKASDAREIIEFVKAWNNKAPLVICPTSYPSITEEQMKELGIKMVIYANHGIRAAIKGMSEVYSEIYNSHGIKTVDSRIASMKEVFELQGMNLMKEHEKKFLITKEKIRAIIPAAGVSRQPSFSEILKDTPLAMLDINGKSLLQRNVETLNSVGVQDITVIAGYKGEKIQLDGLDVIKNKDYDKTDVMLSIMLANGKLDEKTLIVFGDTLFERDIVEKLLKRDEDIVLVIDRSYKTSKTRKQDVDLVKAVHDPVEGTRIINVRQDNPILKIGNVSRGEANYEFIGMSLFSKKGISILKDEFKNISAESKDASKINFNEMIQYLIGKGYKISSMEINTGWAEIHTFEDYKHACRLMVEDSHVIVN